MTGLERRKSDNYSLAVCGPMPTDDERREVARKTHEATRGKYGPRGVNDCPRCGAVPSHQKRKPRKTLVDIGRLWPILDTNPVDGVVCLSCGTGFRVEQLEHDDTYFNDLEEAFEFIPRFCPACGAKVVEEES